MNSLFTYAYFSCGNDNQILIQKGCKSNGILFKQFPVSECSQLKLSHKKITNFRNINSQCSRSLKQQKFKTLHPAHKHQLMIKDQKKNQFWAIPKWVIFLRLSLSYQKVYFSARVISLQVLIWQPRVQYRY